MPGASSSIATMPSSVRASSGQEVAWSRRQATGSSPPLTGRALDASREISSSAPSLGLHVRAGLHAGEIETTDDDIAGLAVHVAARVSALAGQDEVLVSSTVRDLVLGSGVAFSDRGSRVLKGVPGRWRLYAAEFNS